MFDAADFEQRGSVHLPSLLQLTSVQRFFDTLQRRQAEQKKEAKEARREAKEARKREGRREERGGEQQGDSRERRNGGGSGGGASDGDANGAADAAVDDADGARGDAEAPVRPECVPRLSFESIGRGSKSQTGAACAAQGVPPSAKSVSTSSGPLTGVSTVSSCSSAGWPSVRPPIARPGGAAASSGAAALGGAASSSSAARAADREAELKLALEMQVSGSPIQHAAPGERCTSRYITRGVAVPHKILFQMIRQDS